MRSEDYSSEELPMEHRGDAIKRPDGGLKKNHLIKDIFGFKMSRWIRFLIFLFLTNLWELFVSKSVKCILWQIFNEIIDNQDLYRNKDDFLFLFL